MVVVMEPAQRLRPEAGRLAGSVVSTLRDWTRADMPVVCRLAGSLTTGLRLIEPAGPEVSPDSRGAAGPQPGRERLDRLADGDTGCPVPPRPEPLRHQLGPT